MSQLARPLLATIAVLSLAGCGSSPSAEPEPSKKPESALTNLDTCDIMTPQQLQQSGFEFTERSKELDFEPGCAYENESVSIAIYKNDHEDVPSMKDRKWRSFTSININDRSGARAKGANDTEDACWTLVPVGGGTVLAYAFSADPREPIDGCAESLKIAKQIEPNLPE